MRGSQDVLGWEPSRKGMQGPVSRLVQGRSSQLAWSWKMLSSSCAQSVVSLDMITDMNVPMLGAHLS